MFTAYNVLTQHSRKWKPLPGNLSGHFRQLREELDYSR